MTTQDHQIIDYCPNCALEYVGGHCAPCPLCRLNNPRFDAWAELRAAEPYQVIEHTTPAMFQDALNQAMAEGWTVEAIRIGHSENRDAGDPLYIAVLRRGDYDHERHVKAFTADKEAEAVYQQKKQEIRAETKAFRAARIQEARS